MVLSQDVFSKSFEWIYFILNACYMPRACHIFRIFLRVESLKLFIIQFSSSSCPSLSHWDRRVIPQDRGSSLASFLSQLLRLNCGFDAWLHREPEDAPCRGDQLTSYFCMSQFFRSPVHVIHLSYWEGRWVRRPAAILTDIRGLP